MEINVTEILDKILKTYQLYGGTSYYLIFFAVVMIYLWLTESKKNVKVVLVYVSLVVLVVFFFPFTAYMMLRLIGDDETYYRILWLLPVSIGICYGAVRLVIVQKKPLRKIAVGIICLLLLIIGGDYTYDNPGFSESENLYKVPDEIIAICEMIEVDGREVTAVFPSELLQYVRQYSPYVHMPYGRDIIVERWNNRSALFDLMEAETIDSAQLAIEARNNLCNYIVIKNGRVDEGLLAQHDYDFFGSSGVYDIYIDNTAYLGLE